MWATSLETFLLLFTLKTLVAVGNTYPTTGLDTEPITNNIMAPINDTAAPVEPYICVYISLDIDPCKFTSYKGILTSFQRAMLKNKDRKLFESNKTYFAPRPSKKLPGQQTIIYEVIGCVPPRLPFVLPWCTDQDLSDKKREINQLYAFETKGVSKVPYEFPSDDRVKTLRLYRELRKKNRSIIKSA
ncbi:PREDICTED: uncharacterized protein LOC105565032 [Vollenhovia emeryi]|uniref:uncharacterized protein LOC105565032 n=1 Tax=Vollenhovia emeryi TaxID=411798 RepID=UPI0005F4F454|nr:PREDICTED: uncharacterized protein LOC105565032 [Vollenhovia emeryi]XP_011873243.1 PREDICTED: uncharacterized protein LOC105565032 [Vollenhovia emeryi]XP_011873244.1 PREDICTED: uncharacterized protein LOC105565032 [Vollenhovia emeryi]XP_011873245.1 PREDICTED: uncharacterized protein LOC105565032 [Vollenhovia emeryi]XP_011873246.1 PREDICTED: uncharacterized protein LOC105565032 [Vollenhovia emeryi]